jgi:hypothetical protein
MDRPLMDEPDMQTSEDSPKTCGGMMKIVVCVVVVLALAGVGYFFGPRFGGRGSAEATAQRPNAAAASLATAVGTARGQIALYSQHHNGAHPDFAAHPDWEQLAQKTDAKGALSRTGQLGPYLDRKPSNPLRRGTRVQVVRQPPGASFRCTSEDVGFVFDTSAGKLYGVDADGKLLDQ